MALIGKPNWARWQTLPEWYLWQAVALSVDLEPSQIPRDGLDPGDFDNVPPDFEERAEILDQIVGMHCAVQSGLLADEFYGAPLGAAVAKGAFVRWAQKSGWTLPAELAAIGEADPVAQEGVQEAARGAADTLAPKERNHFLRIIRVLADLASLPPEPFKAGEMVASHASKLGIELKARAVGMKLKEASKLPD